MSTWIPRSDCDQGLRKSTELANSADPPNNLNKFGVESVIVDGWYKIERREGPNLEKFCIPECTLLNRWGMVIGDYQGLDNGWQF
jgi:hypothetical protein